MNLRYRLFPLLLLAAFAAKAEVYKWVDAEGNVHYGDAPPSGSGAAPVKLPELSTYHDTTPPPSEPAAETAAKPAPFTGYTQVAIVQPAPGGTIRANDQRVQVSIELKPALQPGHKIQVMLDGRAVGAPYAGTAVELSGVFRGEHTLQAKVLDSAGKPLAESAAITFNLRQISIINKPSAP